MSVQIRAAKLSDEVQCMELLNLLGEKAGEAFSPLASEVFKGLLDESGGQILVASDEEQLLGMVSVSYSRAMRYGGEYCQLEELIVNPAARGKNVGALLMNAIVDKARQRGCADFGLYLIATTESNQSFYEKFGFTKVGSEMRQNLG
ncbi:MAG: GNAT family N-acetyltransferase [bacterium]